MHPVSRDHFADLVAAAIAALPPDLRRHLDRVQISIEDEPSPEDYRLNGVPDDEDLFGLFEGSALTDSMIDADINDGDTVIVEPGQPKHGDIVAALIDGETTLKRLIKQGGKVFLKAENKNYPDLMPVNELVIQGLAKTVMRRI